MRGLKGVIVGLMAAALVFGAGIKTGWDWRGSSFNEAAVALQAEATADQARKNEALRAEIAGLKQRIDDTEKAADLADQARLDAIRLLTVASNGKPRADEVAAINQIVRGK